MLISTEQQCTMITSYHFKCFKKNRRILSCSPITSVLICINFGHTNLCKVSTTEASNCSQATLKWKLFQMNVDLLIWTLVDQTLFLTCSLRQDPKAKDWLHTKARRGALVNTSALSARGSGWVGTPGPTWDRNASNAISMFILINRYSIHILTAHIMWHYIILLKCYMQVFLICQSTLSAIFQEVLMAEAQQVPLKPETQTQGICLTQIPLELKKGSFFRKSNLSTL